MRPVVLTALLTVLLQTGLEAQVPPDSAVVAEVGSQIITVRDLLDSYEFGPAFVRRQNEPLRTHLQFMIYERLLALEGERQGADTTAFVRDRARGLEEDLAVAELYHRRVLSNVSVTEADVDTAMVKARMNLRLRWLYREDRLGAGSAVRELAYGISFDSLYERDRNQEEGAGERSLETTLLMLERDNPEFASRIGSLRSQRVSEPIEGPDGFYIVRLDEVWQNPLMTESEMRDLRVTARKILVETRADAVARAYVRAQMRTANPVMKADGFNILRAHIADRGLSRDTQVRWEIPRTFMTEAGPMPIASSDEFLDRGLVRVGREEISVRDYIRWYDIRQFQFDRRSPEAFASSVKRSVWKMAQDRLLSNEAYDLGLHRVPEVAHEAGKWRAKLLYLAARADVGRMVQVTDSSVLAAYAGGNGRYRDAEGKILPLEEVEQGLRYQLMFEQENTLLQQRLDRLRKEYAILFHEDVLGPLSASVSRESGAVDVVWYRPGGTFPRVAFPTIDDRWQSFR
ncbi:MAG: peptidylprolyl isomerase [Bacteroidota bacterium]